MDNLQPQSIDLNNYPEFLFFCLGDCKSLSQMDLLYIHPKRSRLNVDILMMAPLYKFFHQTLKIKLEQVFTT